MEQIDEVLQDDEKMRHGMDFHYVADISVKKDHLKLQKY